MKKKIFGLLSCIMAVLPRTVVYAQADDLLVYNPIAQTARTAAVKSAEVISYKDYVGVYVRAKVMRTFLDAFTNAAQVHWHLDGDLYLASFKQSSQLCKALFDNKGGLIYAIQYGTEKNLPRDVRRLVHYAYRDYRITAVSEVDRTDKKAWVINLQTANRLIVVQVLDGALEELYNYKTHF